MAETPDVDFETALLLWVRAGGRCSFPSCNEYLLQDNLTTDDIKHGHIAHIVARKKNGPRGNDELPFEVRSQIDNLILVCRKHHAVIDDKKLVEKYPKELLLAYKQQHEELIFELTACTPDQRSKVIKMIARIAGENVSASYSQICAALLDQGKFPREKETIDIDLTQHPDGETEAFLHSGMEVITTRVHPIYERQIVQGDVQHVSVFAIGSIPLLVYLGAQLSNKVPTDIYQRHRDTQDWLWKPEPGNAQYGISLVSEGTDVSQVALILSLSGRLALDQLPRLDNFYVYEITLQGQIPNTDFLRTNSDLERFRQVYQQFLALVRDQHTSAETIHFFPAIPAPIAVVCGRELLHKIPPSLQVYDRSRQSGGFRYVLEVR